MVGYGKRGGMGKNTGAVAGERWAGWLWPRLDAPIEAGEYDDRRSSGEASTYCAVLENRKYGSAGIQGRVRLPGFNLPARGRGSSGTVAAVTAIWEHWGRPSHSTAVKI